MLEALLNRCHARARTEQNRTLTKYLCLSCLNETYVKQRARSQKNLIQGETK